MGGLTLLLHAFPFVFSRVCVCVCPFSCGPFAGPGPRHFDFYSVVRYTKEQRKHERCVHHSCNYEALCCIRPGRNSAPTETRAKRQNDDVTWKGEGTTATRGALEMLLKKKIVMP